MVIYINEIKKEGGPVCNLTISDGAQHEAMMHSLVNVLRMAVECPSKRDSDDNHLMVALDLLDAIIPDEFQLNAGIKKGMEAYNHRKKMGLEV